MVQILLTTLIGLATGCLGYLISNFWMDPIFRFRKIRQQIDSDLIFFANAIIPDGLNDEMRKRVEDRRVANRRNSAELMACMPSLPFWYNWWLKYRKVDLSGAAQELIGLSNAADFSSSDRHILKVIERLKISS